MQLFLDFPKKSDFRFDTFIVDDKNREATALCRKFAAENSDGPGWASMVIFGEKGAGKTHLLSAMGQIVTDSGGAALYLNCDLLASTIDDALSYDEVKKHLAKYEKATYLAVDGLEKIENSTVAQEQVFHLYNAVKESGGRIALSVTTPPTTWIFEDYLSTRLLWGQVVELKPVGDDGMVRVLIKMAKEKGLHLPKEAAVWLTTRLPRDPASLITALTRIDRHSMTKKRKVTIQLVKEAIEEKDDA